MKTQPRALPTIAEIEATLRTDRYGRLWALSPIRLVLAAQTRVTYVLLAVGLNSRQVTVLWLVVSLVAYGVMVIGTPWAFLIGALLVYVQMILDGTDGEIGRYYKQFITEEEDIRTHINGIYLDLLSHAICSTLWGIALGVGLYRCTGEWVVLLAGVALSVFHVTRQTAFLAEAYLLKHFDEPVRRIIQDAGFGGFRSNSQWRGNLLVIRLLDNMEWFLGAGTKFNFIILVCSLADVLFWITGNRATCSVLFFTFLALGGACPFLVFFRAVKAIRGHTVLNRIIRNRSHPGKQ